MDKFNPKQSTVHKPVPKEKKTVLYFPGDVIDHTFKMIHINELIQTKTPFLYLRYNDGEWRALLGREIWNKYWEKTGNGDHHDFFDDMMDQLRDVLNSISKLDKTTANIHVGLHGTWDQEYIQPYVVENNLKDNIHWVSTIRPEEGVYELTFLDFLKFIDHNDSICKVLVSKEALSPIVKRLGIEHHVTVPELNSFLEYDRIYDECLDICTSETRPILFMSSMGPACNILGFRLYEKYANIMYFNTGSVFDSFISNPIRGYIRKPEFINWFEKHYSEYMSKK